jgi:hypothetical protein
MTDTPFHTLTTLKDLEKLIAGGGGESLTLEFKASPALRKDKVDEICKDIPAMANSAGGQIIYGVAEDKKTKTFSLDGGVTDPKITLEWLDQVLNSKIQPRMSGVRLQEIKMASGMAVIATIPQTQTGPHQSPDGKYYKRFELHAVPMHDYELRDIMRRSVAPQPFLRLTFEAGLSTNLQFPPNEEISRPVELLFTIGNRSAEPARFVIAEIGIDPSLNIEGHENFDNIGFAADGEGDALCWLRRTLGGPDQFPIFKEAMQQISRPNLTVSVASRFMLWEFLIKATLSSPGFNGTQRWRIRRVGGQIRIEELL